MDNLSYFISMMPLRVINAFSQLDDDTLCAITEIRLRREKPIIIYLLKHPYFLTNSGLQKKVSLSCIVLTESELREINDELCNNSYHTNMSSMINGYITVNNGARVGIGCEAVYKDNAVKSVKNITSLNIRIPHSVPDCSRHILELINMENLPSIIVAGPPASGKTTFLRDMCIQLSSGFNGSYSKVAVIDERKELVISNDGINLDCIAGYKKSKGIEMAIRSLSPQLIVCDEIGSIDEVKSISYGFSCGVSFAVSVHISQTEHIFTNKIIRELIDTGEFRYIVLLKSYTDIFKIIEIGEADGDKNCRNYNDYNVYNSLGNNGM